MTTPTALPALPEPTDEMIAAYLAANAAYWQRTDALPTPPDQWRTGTVKEATREGLRAALAALPAPVAPARELREFLGKMVRAEWVRWAREQQEPKASWLEPWDSLSEPMREVDRRIGEALYRFAAVQWPFAPVAPAEPVLHDEPTGWITDESFWALQTRGGNKSRGTVPIHAQPSAVAKTPLYTAPPRLAAAPSAHAALPQSLGAPAEDIAEASGGIEGGPEEERIEASYWRFDARHKGLGQWKRAPMSERDAFKAEMRNALHAEAVRAEMRLTARGWRPGPAGTRPEPAAALLVQAVEALEVLERSLRYDEEYTRPNKWQHSRHVIGALLTALRAHLAGKVKAVELSDGEICKSAGCADFGLSAPELKRIRAAIAADRKANGWPVPGHNVGVEA